MTKPAREHLLGYVLGTLDPSEVEFIEHQLEIDPALRKEVDVIEQRVAPLESTRVSHEPPTGLANRTCDFIFEQRSMTATLDPPTTASRQVRFHESQKANRESGGGRRGWSLSDVSAIGGVVAILGCIVLPAILQSRQQHLRTVCEDNLRKLGTSLVRFVDINNGSYPPVAKSGPLSVAGAFPVQLVSSNCLTETQCLICPASPLAEDRDDWTVPTVTELQFANTETLSAHYETMGGSYAYNFGYLVDGELVAPKYAGRPLYPVASDAPSGNLHDMSSPFHCGKGQNVLFEDNSVRYVVDCQLAECGNDDIFFNRDGKIAAGLDVDDAVLGRSCDSPILKVSID